MLGYSFSSAFSWFQLPYFARSIIWLAITMSSMMSWDVIDWFMSFCTSLAKSERLRSFAICSGDLPLCETRFQSRVLPK